MIVKSAEALQNSTKASFNDLLEKFLAGQDVTPGSRITYRRALHQFFRWLMAERIAQPTRETVLAYKEALDSRGLRPFTRANYLVAVRRFFEWAEGMKFYPNIAKGVKGARRMVKTHQKNALSVEQIKKLFASIPRETLQGKRDYALINLLVRTGLRLIEICRATLDDLEEHASGQTLLWVRGKGRDGKDAFVIITDGVKKPLAEYLKTRNIWLGNRPIFSSLSDRNMGKMLTTRSVSRIVKTYLRRAGFDSRRLTAHSLRHTFGVMAIRAGSSLYEVQLAMRHTAPTTTEVYLGDIEQAKRLEGGPEKRIDTFWDAEVAKE